MIARARGIASARCGPLLAAGLFALAGWPGTAAGAEAAGDSARVPFVRGGYDDKPYVQGVFTGVRVGGYVEGSARWQREEGATDELGFELTRLNLLTSSRLRDRVEVWTEVEFEDGGEEISLELAQVDVWLHPAANLRGGILLLPLGRFNLAHDAPRNDLPDRPALATDLLGSALSQPGLGLFGEFPVAGRLTYEAYGVTGYDDGILEAAGEGTRLPLGKSNREDGNASPAWVGRVEWSRPSGAASSARHHVGFGLSGYHGAYNVYRVEGMNVDARRDLRIGVADLELRFAGMRLAAEGALVEIDLPAGLAGIFAARQSGAFVEWSRPLGRDWIRAMPGSYFTAVVRAEAVDFDRDLAGDSRRDVHVGLNFRPIPESCFKLAWSRGETRDRFNNRASNAAWLFGLATYF